MQLCFPSILGFCALLIIPFSEVSAQHNPEDMYTFCTKGKLGGDNSACVGFCDTHRATTCSAETGTCSCSHPSSKLRTPSGFQCKSARPRTRCYNACKTFGMITPQFRRGETKICENKMENTKMCFCLAKS